MTMFDFKKPETVKQGDVIPVLIAPFGSWPQNHEGRVIQQVVDSRTADDLIAAFNEKKADVLVDADHQSEKGGSTRALAWIKSLVKTDLGIVANFELTETGANELNGKEYRFVSPCWNVEYTDEEQGIVRPTRLTSVALTNRPNLPVPPILNSKKDGEGKDTHKETKVMNKIAQALGLKEDATEDEIVSAIVALKESVDKMKTDALNKEADAFIEKNKGQIKDCAAFKNSYLADPEGTVKLFNMLDFGKKTETTPPAKNDPPPKNPIDTKDAKDPVLNSMEGYAKCKTPEEKVAFLATLSK